LLGLDKVYNFNALFGFATDSYDILGKVMRVERIRDLDEARLHGIANLFKGQRLQQYPPFSSKTVGGRALHEWARMEGLDQIERPTNEINVYQLNFRNLKKISARELLGRLLMDISKVKGDFRQHECLVLWKEILSKYKDDLFIGQFSAHVSSGTYIRNIVNDMGNTLGYGACALSITRTSVGDFQIEQSVR
jgi:tRNA pseudouridine55 synthase